MAAQSLVFSTILLFSIFLGPQLALAQISTQEAAPEFYPPVSGGPPKPEDWHEDMGESVITLANDLDSYFGTIRADDERNGSTLRLTPGITVGEFASPQSGVDMRLNLKLKNLEDFGKDVERKLFGRSYDEQPVKKDAQGQEVPAENWAWTRSVETSAAGLAPPTYGILLRVRRNIQSTRFIHRFWWSTGWHSQVLWENNANFSSDYKINKHLLFRWFNQWTYNMSSSLQTTSHGPSLYQSINDDLSISYDTRINMAVEANAWVLDNYGFATTFRKRLKNRWMYLQAVPGINFGRTHFFQRDLSIFVGLEMVFGDVNDLPKSSTDMSDQQGPYTLNSL